MNVEATRPLCSAALATLLLSTLAAPPASAYSTPAEVPDPFQDYTARDYADALWNLETTTYVRTHERESHGDCEVLTYEVSHPLGLEPTRTYVHVADPDDWWCTGADGDELRDELDAKDDADEDFHHGRPYENTNQRVPYYGTWADVNGNGHTSRTEIHARDTGNSEFTVSGTYWDHYSGQHVDIGETETHGEHMIPVGHTWPEMQHRSRDARVAYYNDHMNLTSTIGWINREKAGHTPSEWMPSDEDAWCAYGMTWTHIANKHEISLFQSDIEHLRELLWDCLDEELDDAEILPEDRSEDLVWQELPDSSDPEEITEEPGGGPRQHYSARDLSDALWNMERHVGIRSVERESHDDCDVQTYTVTHPRSGEERVYARVISQENAYCEGAEGDELREELEEQAEEDEDFFHGGPLAGQRRDYFGFWTVGEDGVNTRHQTLARDLEAVEWNSTETAVTGGGFYDPYSGGAADYAGSDTVLDHILPVEHAWVEMEHRGHDERVDYYNDQHNLLAVTAATAREKGAEAPRNWMPPHEDFQCRYAVAWVHTAVKYEISLFASDAAELRETLYRCLTEETEADDGELEGPRRAELEWASHPPY